MSGYNTECLPHDTRIEPEGSDSELHYRFLVVFACGREVPHAYAWRYKAAPNRKRCRHCTAIEHRRAPIEWDEVDRRWLEESARHRARDTAAATGADS